MRIWLVFEVEHIVVVAQLGVERITLWLEKVRYSFRVSRLDEDPSECIDFEIDSLENLELCAFNVEREKVNFHGGVCLLQNASHGERRRFDDFECAVHIFPFEELHSQLCVADGIFNVRVEVQRGTHKV